MPLPRLQPQHYPLALLLSAACAVLALVLFGQIPGHGRWVSELGNSAHGPAFAIVTLILLALLRRVPGRNASILHDDSLAIAGALLLGALIELMQLATGRDACATTAPPASTRSAFVFVVPWSMVRMRVATPSPSNQCRRRLRNAGGRESEMFQQELR